MALKIHRALPDPFPPSWAHAWGEDEFGLYADFEFCVEVFSQGGISKQNKTWGAYSDAHGGSQIQRFRWIAAGSFLMGSPEEDPERLEREQQHSVTLTQGYWLADTTVTQALWELVTGENPSHFSFSPQNPVEKVSWNDCISFVNIINGQFFDASMFRLPTEAEWEHACRAGTTSSFSFEGNITSKKVNCDGIRKDHDYGLGSRTIEVKSLPSNPWGLYEMHGNVWEWCLDAWQERLGTKPVVDPYIRRGSDRVIRGGSWSVVDRLTRSANRYYDSPFHIDADIGFRLSVGSLA